MEIKVLMLGDDSWSGEDGELVERLNEDCPLVVLVDDGASPNMGFDEAEISFWNKDWNCFFTLGGKGTAEGFEVEVTEKGKVLEKVRKVEVIQARGDIEVYLKDEEGNIILQGNGF